MKPRVFLACSALLASCANSGEAEKGASESETRPKLVGRVASVPGGGSFALIESYGTWKVPEGGQLSSMGPDGSAANLVATGEKLGQFAAADIRSGSAKIGDSVYFRPIKDDKAGESVVDSPVPNTAPTDGESRTSSAEVPANP